MRPGSTPRANGAGGRAGSRARRPLARPSSPTAEEGRPGQKAPSRKTVSRTPRTPPRGPRGVLRVPPRDHSGRRLENRWNQADLVTRRDLRVVLRGHAAAWCRDRVPRILGNTPIFSTRRDLRVPPRGPTPPDRPPIGGGRSGRGRGESVLSPLTRAAPASAAEGRPDCGRRRRRVPRPSAGRAADSPSWPRVPRPSAGRPDCGQR